MGGDLAARELRIALEIDEDIDLVVIDALRRGAVADAVEIDEAVEGLPSLWRSSLRSSRAIGIGDDLEAGMVVRSNSPAIRTRGRVAEEIRREIADTQFAAALGRCRRGWCAKQGLACSAVAQRRATCNCRA